MRRKIKLSENEKGISTLKVSRYNESVLSIKGTNETIFMNKRTYQQLNGKIRDLEIQYEKEAEKNHRSEEKNHRLEKKHKQLEEKYKQLKEKYQSIKDENRDLKWEVEVKSMDMAEWRKIIEENTSESELLQKVRQHSTEYHKMLVTPPILSLAIKIRARQFEETGKVNLAAIHRELYEKYKIQCHYETLRKYMNGEKNII